MKTMTKIENIRKWIKNKAGVSPIIAIILMVAITVVLAATIYVWVSGFGGGGGEALSMSVSQIGNAELRGTGTAKGYYANFTVTALSGNASYSNLRILVGSTNLGTGPATSLTNGTWTREGGTYIQAGDVIEIRMASNPVGQTLQIISTESGSVICSTTIR
ncbi:MAG: type IV pilin [Thermoplasmata archaeon]|nr:type IV pilin [Thermoplasmata archaeon]